MGVLHFEVHNRHSIPVTIDHGPQTGVSHPIMQEDLCLFVCLSEKIFHWEFNFLYSELFFSGEKHTGS